MVEGSITVSACQERLAVVGARRHHAAVGQRGHGFEDSAGDAAEVAAIAAHRVGRVLVVSGVELAAGPAPLPSITLAASVVVKMLSAESVAVAVIV